jgi:hypothetical protein
MQDMIKRETELNQKLELASNMLNTANSKVKGHETELQQSKDNLNAAFHALNEAHVTNRQLNEELGTEKREKQAIIEYANDAYGKLAQERDHFKNSFMVMANSQEALMNEYETFKQGAHASFTLSNNTLNDTVTALAQEQAMRAQLTAELNEVQGALDTYGDAFEANGEEMEKMKDREARLRQKLMLWKERADMLGDAAGVPDTDTPLPTGPPRPLRHHLIDLDESVTQIPAALDAPLTGPSAPPASTDVLMARNAIHQISQLPEPQYSGVEKLTAGTLKSFARDTRATENSKELEAAFEKLWNLDDRMGAEHPFKAQLQLRMGLLVARLQELKS